MNLIYTHSHTFLYENEWICYMGMQDEWNKVSPGGTSCSEDPLRGQMMNHNSRTQGPSTPVNFKSILPQPSVIGVSKVCSPYIQSQVGSSHV